MTHISTLDLHRHRYGELSPSELDRVSAHLGACERCQRRLGSQVAERQAFALGPTPAAIAELSLPSHPANRRIWPRILVVTAFAVAAAASISLVVAPSAEADLTRAEVAEDIRAKGDLPDLEVWIDRDRGPRALRDGETLAAGDQVQLLFRPHGAAYVTLAGRDGQGKIEVWRTVQPMGDHLQPAPFALTLDASPGPQRFYAIGSDRPLGPDDVEKALAGEVPEVRHLTELILPKK